MYNPLRMQVSHPFSNVRSKGEAEPPIEGDVIIQQDIVQTSLGAVFIDDMKLVLILDSGSNKLAQVWMIQGPKIDINTILCAYIQQRIIFLGRSAVESV